MKVSRSVEKKRKEKKKKKWGQLVEKLGTDRRLAS